MPDTAFSAWLKKISHVFPFRGEDEFIAMAVILENNLDDDINMDKWTIWRKLANAICSAMSKNDVARFSLYDYMDAIINHSEQPDWSDLLAEYEANEDNFFAHLLRLADDKRITYAD